MVFHTYIRNPEQRMNESIHAVSAHCLLLYTLWDLTPGNGAAQRDKVFPPQSLTERLTGQPDLDSPC